MYYENEHMDNPCIVTLAVNPKEYLEIFKDRFLNKKHKGIKKGSSDLGFEKPSNHHLLILKKYRE